RGRLQRAIEARAGTRREPGLALGVRDPPQRADYGYIGLETGTIADVRNQRRRCIERSRGGINQPEFRLRDRDPTEPIDDQFRTRWLIMHVRTARVVERPWHWRLRRVPGRIEKIARIGPPRGRGHDFRHRLQGGDSDLLTISDPAR